MLNILCPLAHLTPDAADPAGCAKPSVPGASKAQQTQPSAGDAAVCPEEIRKSPQRMVAGL